MTNGTYSGRLERLKLLVEEERADALVITSQANLRYFTGYVGSGALVVRKEGAVLLVPPLEYLRALSEVEEAEAGVEVAVYKPYDLPAEIVLAEGETPRVFEGGLEGALSALLHGASKLLCDDMPLSLYEKLSSKFELKVVTSRIAEWRSIKEPWEVERIKVAVDIAERALNKLLSSLHEGLSELEGAGLIEHEMRSLGAEDHAFPPIVAIGVNTVYPHARPSTSRRLRPGTPVLVDLGAKYQGYCSDITRTTFYGAVDKEFKDVCEVVLEALNEAVDSAAPGVEACEVDAVARKVLRRKGLDKYFIHSLGHGIGLEVHEVPRLSPSSKTKLEPGMVVTIEPGVYIPKRFGVRIEEVVVITRRGARRLSSYPAVLW